MAKTAVTIQPSTFLLLLLLLHATALISFGGRATAFARHHHPSTNNRRRQQHTSLSSTAQRYMHPSDASAETSDLPPADSNPDTTATVYIGLDVGTQGTKAVLYHPATCSVLGRASVQYGLSPNPNNVPGRAEQDPQVWVDAVRECLRTLAEEFDLSGGGGGTTPTNTNTGSNDNDGGNKYTYRVGGIGVSGQQHGFVPLDSSLRPIRDAKLWCDVEASQQATQFSSEATAVMNGQREWTVPPGFTAPKVMWMRDTEPENWERVRWSVLPHDYINLVLRGGTAADGEGDGDKYENADGTNVVPTTDAGDASGTGVLDPATRQYVPGIADIVDGGTGRYLKSLPTILPPNGIAGYVSPAIKRELLGIDDPDDKVRIPISAGSGDNMCSALGCGCVEPGMAVLSLGTSGTIFGVSNAPVRTGTPVAPFCDATGRHLPLACVMSCTAVLQSVLEHWCNAHAAGGEDEEGGRATVGHEEATEMAGGEPPGCHGLTFLPYLSGERTPNWPDASGALLGITPSNINCMAGGKPGLVYRAAMEGITYLLADALEEMRSACGDGFRPTSLLVVGGGSKNRLWRQMLADVLGLELRFPLEAESAALGAAFQAGAASSGMDVDEFVKRQRIEMEDTVVKPSTDKETLRLYEEGLARYRMYSRKLFAQNI